MDQAIAPFLPLKSLFRRLMENSFPVQSRKKALKIEGLALSMTSTGESGLENLSKAVLTPFPLAEVSESFRWG